MMSHSEGKAEVQVTRPGHAFPFSPATAPPHPHINQWCRFSVPERLPLKPFRQDRLARLPLPASLMANSKVANSAGTSVFPTTMLNTKHSREMDPFQKIQQLEKNLAFVRENHAAMLKGLHEEISDLKQKNRELIFEIVTGLPALPKEESPKNCEKDISEEQKDKIEKLEKEIRKLRVALKDAMKTNSSLTNQLHQLKREKYSRSSHVKGSSKTPPDSAIDDGQQSPRGPSPQMEEYTDTLRQIQRAATHHSGKHGDRRHRSDNVKNEWSDAYIRNGNGYQHNRHNHHHHHQKSFQQSQQQPRLPRLPLHNQQNYQHQQYEIQYRQRNSSSLPALKQPLVPVVDQRFDKPRKNRGPRAAKFADQVING
ncbi:uncharacterized protein LOC129224601 [Uloborus diversus]|uniref:uncharacterized protein LOC129224601 n=1 Tax=Uloborus diversus TaxID=327109 RepID=UPI00240942EB|nr:uncharacterized protein LOC129224601 [Uloborus diversus]